MPTLKILLLGPPAVYYDEMPLTIQRRTLRVLLYYLAQQENMIDRSQLILALWPDDDESTGRRRLRELLSKLRAELPDPALLITDQDQIGLDRSRLYVDSLHFDELFTECSPIIKNIPRHLPLPERTHQQIRAAIDLWRTPFFMAGAQMPHSEAFDRWLSDTGRTMERRRILLIDRQADHFAATGDIETALSWLDRIIDDDPGNEDWQVRYLSWLHQLNRRKEVSAYYDRLVRYYRDHNEPLPERIKNVVYKSNQRAIGLAQDENPLWPPPAQLQTPFVGRVKEMQELNAAFQRGGVLSLLGEAGSGKTRLIYEFSRQIGPTARLLVAGSFSSTKNLPYQPVLDMLRQSVTESEWKALPAAWIAPLIPLMPELSHFVSQASRMADSQMVDLQGMIFESFHQVFKYLAKQSRLLIFLDDAYHTDRSTLDLLGYLFSRNFFEHNGLLVVSARPDEVTPEYEKFIEQVCNPLYRFEEIRLSDFSLADASALITLMLGRSYPVQLVQKLLEISDRKPLLLVEMLHSVIEYSTWVDLEEAIDKLPVPRSILDLLQRRIGMLSANALRVLQVGSVAGGNFKSCMLERSLNLSPEEIVDALEELERFHLIQPVGSSSTGANYRFLYNRIKNIVLADLSEARKRLMHLSIAKAMKSNPLDCANPSAIAGHFEAAGELKEAFDNWILAGNRACEIFSKTDAVYAFSRAASLIQYLGNFVSNEEIYWLYADWGNLLNDFGDFKSGMDLFYNLQSLGNQRQSHVLLGTAFNGLSRIFRNMGEYDRSLQYNLQAEEQLKILGFMPEYFLVFTRRAITCMYLEDYEKSDRAIKTALELATHNQNWRVQINLSSAFIQMADISSYKGLLNKTLEICELGLRSIEPAFNNPDIEIIRLKMGQVYCFLGQPKKAFLLANQVLKLAAEWNHNRLIGFAKQAKAQAEMEMGWMGEALDDLEEAKDIAAQYNYADLSQKTYSLLGNFYYTLGEFYLADQAYILGLESTIRPYYRLDNQIRHGYASIYLEKFQEGLDIIYKALQEAESNGYRQVQTTAYTFLASCYINIGDIPLAEEAIAAYKNTSSQNNEPIWEEVLKMYTVWLEYRKGNRVNISDLDSVISFTSEMGDIWLEISALELTLAIQNRQMEDTSQTRRRLAELRDYLLERARRDDVRTMITNRFNKILDDGTIRKSGE